MLNTLSPALHDAALTGLGAAGMALVAAGLPFLNQLLAQLRPDAKTVAQILSMMDVLMQGRADLTIKGVDILGIAQNAAQKISETDKLTEGQVAALAVQAAEKWSVGIFQRKMGGDAA